MDRYCIFCGAPLVGDGPCPCISKYTKSSPGIQSAAKEKAQPQRQETPVSKTENTSRDLSPEHRISKASANRKPRFFDFDAEETADQYAMPPEDIELLPEEEEDTEPVVWPHRLSEEAEVEQEEQQDQEAEEEIEQEEDPGAEEETHNRGSILSVLRNIPGFLCEYCVNFLPYGRELARAGDLRYGLAFMLVSIALSAGSTMIYGMFHLDEFFLRWYVAGFMTPVIAFAASFAFVLVVMGRARSTASAKSIMVTVGLSSVFPSVLQFCSLILSTLDGDGKVFQFFALLILLTWLFSLFSLTFSIYRVKIGLGTLLLSVAFSFLAIVIIRAVWIWYLTGYSNFAFYLPSSLYPGELYESLVS